MSKHSASRPAGGDGQGKTPAPEGGRKPRTPLTPRRVGDAVGETADPEQDVAPNLGGEEQMQDA